MARICVMFELYHCGHDDDADDHLGNLPSVGIGEGNRVPARIGVGINPAGQSDGVALDVAPEAGVVVAEMVVVQAGRRIVLLAGEPQGIRSAHPDRLRDRRAEHIRDPVPDEGAGAVHHPLRLPDLVGEDVIDVPGAVDQRQRQPVQINVTPQRRARGGVLGQELAAAAEDDGRVDEAAADARPRHADRNALVETIVYVAFRRGARRAAVGIVAQDELGSLAELAGREIAGGVLAVAERRAARLRRLAEPVRASGVAVGHRGRRAAIVNPAAAAARRWPGRREWRRARGRDGP